MENVSIAVAGARACISPHTHYSPAEVCGRIIKTMHRYRYSGASCMTYTVILIMNVSHPIHIPRS